MAQFALTDVQRSRLAVLQDQSFARYAGAIGVTPRLLAEQRHRLIQLEINRWRELAASRNDESAARLEEEARELVAAQDFWTLQRLAHERVRARLSRQIIDNAASLPIDWSYLTSLAISQQPAETTPGPEGALEAILDGVPLVLLFDNDFNAFLDFSFEVGDLPFICVYEHLTAVCYLVLDVLLNHIFRFTPGTLNLELLELDEIRAISGQPDIVALCADCLDLLLGRRDTLEIPNEARLSRRRPELHFHVATFVEGARDFVWFHEFGHLLRAHVRMGACHQAEFEADEFAWRAIMARKSNSGRLDVPLYRAGALMALTLIALIDIVAQSSSTSHPRGSDRLSALIGLADPNTAWHPYWAQEALLVLCETPIAIRYNVRYRLTNSR